MDKKRRLDDTTAKEEAKIAAKTGADFIIMMGETLAFVEERLEGCNTLEEYEQAKKDIARYSIDITQRMMGRVIKMTVDVNKLGK